jgi:hypothetical protein
MNIRHEVLEWFGRSRGVIAIRLVLMYYAIEIYSSFFQDLSEEGLRMSSMWIYHFYL